MKSILNQYHKRINILEGEKYDLEYEVAKKDMEVEKVFFRDKQRDERDATINAIQILFPVFRSFFFPLSHCAKRISLYLATSDLHKLLISRRYRKAEYFPESSSSNVVSLATHRIAQRRTVSVMLFYCRRMRVGRFCSFTCE